MDFLVRTRMLIGNENIEKLNKSHVIVFGIGGVGSFVCEGLARSGIGQITLVDFDTIAMSNINRQIHAFFDNVGEKKVDVMKERLLKINPHIIVNIVDEFVDKENIRKIIKDDVTYIADAIDTVTSKIELAIYAMENNIPIISSMGAANKLDPTRFKVMDLYKTTMDPLAKVLRRELRKRGVNKLKVVCSDENPIVPVIDYNEKKNNRPAPGSIAWVPSVAGLIISGEIVKDISNL